MLNSTNYLIYCQMTKTNPYQVQINQLSDSQIANLVLDGIL
jgi:hypothetical protein